MNIIAKFDWITQNLYTKFRHDGKWSEWCQAWANFGEGNIFSMKKWIFIFQVQLSHFVGRLEEVNDWTTAMTNSEKEKLAVNFQSSVIFFPFSFS